MRHAHLVPATLMVSGRKWVPNMVDIVLYVATPVSSVRRALRVPFHFRKIKPGSTSTKLSLFTRHEYVT